ncbi:MAG: hypothetical protein WCJ29_03655 [bacterium]
MGGCSAKRTRTETLRKIGKMANRKSIKRGLWFRKARVTAK